jgi:hypothetical protein
MTARAIAIWNLVLGAKIKCLLACQKYCWKENQDMIQLRAEPFMCDQCNNISATCKDVSYIWHWCWLTLSMEASSLSERNFRPPLEFVLGCWERKMTNCNVRITLSKLFRPKCISHSTVSRCRWSLALKRRADFYRSSVIVNCILCQWANFKLTFVVKPRRLLKHVPRINYFTDTKCVPSKATELLLSAYISPLQATS